jgi:hypothetical protein
MQLTGNKPRLEERNSITLRSANPCKPRVRKGSNPEVGPLERHLVSGGHSITSSARAVSVAGTPSAGGVGNAKIPSMAVSQKVHMCSLAKLPDLKSLPIRKAFASQRRWRVLTGLVEGEFLLLGEAPVWAAARSPACRRPGTGDRATPSNYATSYSLT